MRHVAVIVAIDGPAGAGKSTAARAVAAALGFAYLDTRRDVPLRGAGGLGAGGRPPSTRRSSRSSSVSVSRLGGRDVTEEIRSPRVRPSPRRSPPTRRSERRSWRQRPLMASGDWVAEGRDIGTVVAPDAEVKVYLDGRPGGARAPARAELGRDAARCSPSRRARRARQRARALAARAGRTRWCSTRACSTPWRRRADRALVRRASSPRPASACHPAPGQSARGGSTLGCHEGRSRRISERRQVLARQPPHRVARGGRARAPRRHARPQGAPTDWNGRS